MAASDLYNAACERGRALFRQLDSLSLHPALSSKITTFHEEYSLNLDLIKSNVSNTVHDALAGAGISASNLRYVQVYSGKGRLGDKEPAYINYLDGHNGVVLTAEMFKAKDQNSPDKQLWASEIIWQSWLYYAKSEERAASRLRTVGQYFVTNEDTSQIIWESLQFSAATRQGPTPGHVEYTSLDNGFYALLGSPNGKVMMQMLLDHKSHIGYKTVERIVLVGGDSLVLSKPETRTFLLVLSDKRRPLTGIPGPSIS